MSGLVIDSLLIIAPDDEDLNMSTIDRPTPADALAELRRLAHYPSAHLWLVGHEPITGTAAEVAAELAARMTAPGGNQERKNG